MRIHEEEREPLHLILIENNGCTKLYRVHSNRATFTNNRQYSLSSYAELDELLEEVDQQASLFGAYSKLSIFYSGDTLQRFLEEKVAMRIGQYEIEPLPEYYHKSLLNLTRQ